MRRLGTILLPLLLGACGWAQNAPAFKVLIPLLVKDSHNRPVRDLTTESLVISEHKTQVTDFSLLHASELPLDLGIVIDTSTSQRDTTLPEALKGAKDLVNDVIGVGNDRVFFMTFSDQPKTTRWLKKEDLAGVSVDITFDGGTALYDSIVLACKQLGPPDRQHPSRRVLILITDGEDDASHIPLTWAESEVLKSSVVIFAVSTQESPMHASRRGTRALEQLATVAGGESFTWLGRNDMPKAFATIKELLQGMYYANYFPPHPTEKVHEVDIKLSSKAKFEVSYPRKYAWIQ